MKQFAKRISALVLVFVLSLAALAPAASASLPALPSGQCVVDDAGVLSSSTVQAITDLNAQLQWCPDRCPDGRLYGQLFH